MTTLTSIIAPSNILTPSSSATVTNTTISGANNTLTVRMANDVCGTLPVANGGSGQTSYTDGQILIGNSTGNTLTKTTLTGGSNICVTNGNGSITIGYCVPIVYNNSAWVWGAGGNGSRGDNTTVDKSSPVSVVGGFTDWCQVSSGNYFTLGVRQNGSAWGWGCNLYGKLGDNSVTNKSSPVSVVGGFTNWCQISAGESHSLGVRTNGTAWAWGRNTYGTLGDNTVSGKSSPVSIAGGFTDWICLSYPQSGSFTGAAIRSTAT
jgi:hypothetical protein